MELFSEPTKDTASSSSAAAAATPLGAPKIHQLLSLLTPSLAFVNELASRCQTIKAAQFVYSVLI
jgi:hypothetical protein